MLLQYYVNIIPTKFKENLTNILDEFTLAIFTQKVPVSIY